MFIKENEQEHPGNNESEKEKEEELTPEEQYDAEFEKELPKEESEEDKAKREQAEEEKAEKEQEEEQSAEKKETSDDDEKKEEEEKKSDDSPVGLAKALKDTKAWGTKVAQENAELKRKIQEYNAGKATATDVAKAQEARDNANKDIKQKAEKVYEDYPELKDVFEPLIASFDTVQTKISEVEKIKSDMAFSKEMEEKKNHFEREIEPEVLKVHPEFAKIKFDEAYFEWAQAQSPAMKHAAMFSLDPRDLIHAVGEFKKFAGSDKYKSEVEKEEEKKAAVKKNASSLRGGGSRKIEKSKATKLEEVDKNNYDEAWDVA